MENQFKYYKVRTKPDFSYGLLEFKNVDDKDIFFEDSISDQKSIEMRLKSSNPKNINPGDFYSVASVLAFGRKIYDILAPLNLFNVQFISAAVEIKKGEVRDDFWLMHNYNNIACMNLEKSDCDIDDDDGDITWIRKIVLSPEKLSKIPLEERLFFRMEEDFPTHLVHQSIVDKIMEIQPGNLTFIPVEDWHQGMQFD